MPKRQIVSLIFTGGALLILLFLLFFPRASEAPPQAERKVSYVDASDRLGHATSSSFVDSMVASGVCVLDANQDGLPDLFFPGPGEHTGVSEELLPNPRPGNSLFLNRGVDGSGLPLFEDVSEKTGIRNIKKMGIGCAVADYDNDGWEDIVVTNSTLGVLFSEYGYLTSPERDTIIKPPSVFSTDGTDGKYEFPKEGGVTLFRNKGLDEEDIPQFSDVTLEAGLTRGGNGTSAAFADVDNDGFIDLFVANYSDFDFAGFTSPYFGGHSNVLYRNDGDGSFTDVTELAGVAGEREFVYTPSQEKQYGWNPELKDSKGRVVGDPAGNTLAAAFFDYNEDGLVDLITADDIPGRIRLYKNLGDFRFEQVSEENDFETAGAWMGFAIGDIDGNGKQDVFSTNLGGPIGSRHRRSFTADKTYMLDILNPPNKATFYNGLWLHEESGFRNVAKEVAVDWGPWGPFLAWFPRIPAEAASSGVQAAPRPVGLETGEFGFGAVMFDYDNDGDLDLLWIGGIRRSGVLRVTEREAGNPGRLLENQGDGRTFTEVAQDLGIPNLTKKDDRRTYENGRGVAVADFNQDGYYDIVMTNGGGWDSVEAVPLKEGASGNEYFSFSREYRPGSTFLYVSHAGENNWLAVNLEGQRSNRSAVGALVSIEYEEQGKKKRQFREVRAGESFASQHSLETIFGLGKAERVHTLTVSWPSGVTQVLSDIPASQRITVKEE